MLDSLLRAYVTSKHVLAEAPSRLFERKFTPAAEGVNWQRIETLVHGPGASEQIEQQRRGSVNSVVYACLTKLCTAFSEPPVHVYEHMDAEGEAMPLDDHPIYDLFQHPNPFLTLEQMWQYVEWCKATDGNAYWLKVRSGNERTGNVIELWPVSPTVLHPYTERDSENWIDYYKYEIRPGVFERIPIENVVHFRNLLDPVDLRKGISPLRYMVRHIASDDEATKFALALLENFAVPGLVVITKDKSLSKEDAEVIKDAISRNFGTNQRGNVGVMNNEAEVKQFGFSPEQLNLKVLHAIPETRIAAVIGVPPAVAGLSTGLEQTSNYASMREVREMFTEGTLVPLWRAEAATVTQQLLPDFDSTPTRHIHFDMNDVHALQEDRDKLFVRANIVYNGDIVKLNEARQMLGLDDDPDGDVYKSERTAGSLGGPGEGPGTSGDRLTTTVAEPSEPGMGKSLKADQRLIRRFPELFASMAELAEPAMERDLERYFEGQRRRVRGAITNGNGNHA